MTDELFLGEIYEGEPDDRPRHHDGRQEVEDTSAMNMRGIAANVQRNTAQTLQWYTDNRTDPPFDPDGMCLAVCRTARNIPARYASAKLAQDATPPEHRVQKVSNIRKGMVVYYDTVGDSNPYGHIVTVRGRREGVDPNTLASLVVETNSVKANQLVCVPGDYFKRYWGDEFKFAATWLNGYELDLPEPPAAEPVQESVDFQLRAMHISMFVVLSNDKYRADCEKVFTRAETKGFHFVTGTEAGKEEHAEILKAVANDHGFAVRFGGKSDSWVAVRRSFAVGPVEGDYYPVISEPRHRGIVTATFKTEKLGQITVAACHYLRFGRPDAKSPDYEVNLRENKALARKLGDVAAKYGKGANLFFYGGDQNIVDKNSDTFFGENLTSTWDELARWDNTGHGNIDVLASYDNDRRVMAERTRALDDTEFKLHSDHFLIEAMFSVRTVKGA